MKVVISCYIMCWERYEVVNINLTAKPEFIFDKNPGGKVPTIETPHGTLYESLIVCDYLDELANGPAGDQSNKLHPTDSYAKALDRIWVDNFSEVSKTFNFLLFQDIWKFNLEATIERVN